MNGEIGVHNDAPFLNGKIGEDFGMDGAVTIKELNGRPDCSSGGCKGVVDLSSSVGSPIDARGIENGSLSRKDRCMDRNTVCVAVKGVSDGVGTDRKAIIENQRAEGDDLSGNCVDEDMGVKRRENGVLENGDCSANGHVPEIEVDVVEGKQVGVERNSEEVETAHDVDEEHRDNGVLENGDCGTDGSVEEIKVEVLEINDCNVKVESVTEADVADHNDDINCNNEDHSLSNGVAREELLSGSPDGKVEDRVAEHQNGKGNVMGSVDRLISMGSESESVGGLSGGVQPHPRADTNGASEEPVVDQAEPGMQEGLSQAGGSTEVESAGAHIHHVEKSDDEIHKANQTDADPPMSTGTEREDKHDQQIQSATQPEPYHMSEFPNAGDKFKKVDEKIEEVEAGDDSVKEANTTPENFSTEEADTAESDSPIEGHHDDASTTVAELESAVTVFEVPSIDENKDDGDIVLIECPVASDEKGTASDEGDIRGDSVESSSLAAKEEPVRTEVEKEDIENKVIDSDPTETTLGTRAENDSTAVDAPSSCLTGNTSAEVVICFGSFDQSEFSDILSEDVDKKKEDQHTVPDQDIEQSSPQAEVVVATPQSDVVVAEVLVVASLKEQTQFSKVEKKAFNYLIKTPRFEGDLLKSKISDAQLQVEEKTKIRDAIKAEMHGKKSIYKESSVKFGAAVMEEKAARGLLKSKRQDLESVQNEINKVQNAMSLGEIDTQISDVEHRIQHQTLPLKEERELINKIRKLNQLRGQISSCVGGEDELKAALNKREETEERLKILKKDADSVRENCLKAEAVTKATKKICYDDSEKLRKLQTRFKEADEIRQDAYAQLQSLKKELYEKNKPFWKYRDDMTMATDLASKGDRESLSQFCLEQVETFMEAWNKSNKFREEYLKSNARRILRRLGTAEGRSLGPNEEAPSIPPIANERPAPEKSFPQLAIPKLETVVQAVEVESSADMVCRKDADKKKQKIKAKNTVKSPPEIDTVLAILERDEIVEETKGPEVTEEEWELARKAEELRKKEEAEKLLEQRRLEEKAKAKEALERKRRNAERASARAAQKAQKEAEQKEKEREKRVKKKEKKSLGCRNASSDDVPEGESYSPSEVPIEATPAEHEVREKSVPTRRPAKPSHFTKHTKMAPIPAPLRNRGKRKMQPWMWVVAAALLVFALFLAGNARNLF